MSVSVSMPQLGESVTEGTVTRWLKKEGERVEADEPLLEVSTDKVDTEIPSPAAGVLREIAVGEDETVEVGAQLAVIEEGADASGGDAPAESPSDSAAAELRLRLRLRPSRRRMAASRRSRRSRPRSRRRPRPRPSPAVTAATPLTPPRPAPTVPRPRPLRPRRPPRPRPGPRPRPPAQAPAAPPQQAPQASGQLSGGGGDGPYVTPLVRKLAAEHGVDLESVSGTGVGGRIRKQDVLDASRSRREQEAAAQAQATQAQAAQAQAAPAQAAPAQAAPSAPAQAPAPAAQAPAGGAPAAAPTRAPVVPSSLRGTTQRLSRPRAVIAKRMVESLQTSAQLTTVVEADVTAIARLRDRAKADFEAREGVKLSFLPFFALATIEALKVHPKLNAVIDTANNQVTYHDAEHLGIAVDAERGLMVPVVHNAGDLNLGGLARKIADLANRTRSGQVGPDELAGSTFTLTNTGSRGALFDTPIINQPEVGILGTGTVVKRPVVVDDPALGEVIAVRSVVYLALTYDHRLVDGADAARFLVTVKERLEEGSFEAELGL